MHRFSILVLAILVALTAQSGVAAAKDNQKNDQKFGPYTVVSPDSGTCGNDWATDTFTRTFEVKDNGDGTFRLRVEDKGTFVTFAGASPGACQTTGKHGLLIRAGVTGKMHGTATGTVTGGALIPGAVCPAVCFMGAFTTAFFGPTAQFTCVSGGGACDFKWQYSSGDKHLLYRHWTNSSNGNKGDIADAGVTGDPGDTDDNGESED